MNLIGELCTCGRPVRYMVAEGEYACNKYLKCPAILVPVAEVLANQDHPYHAELLSILEKIKSGELSFF